MHGYAGAGGFCPQKVSRCRCCWRRGVWTEFVSAWFAVRSLVLRVDFEVEMFSAKVRRRAARGGATARDDDSHNQDATYKIER